MGSQRYADDIDPKVLVPYIGPSTDPHELDVLFYLRPESNGVAVESTVLTVIRRCRAEGATIQLGYMANIPGSTIIRRRVVERHYATRLFFAVHGGAAFTPDMRRQFTEHYRQAFHPERVIGAFEALRRLSWHPEQLFDLWVDQAAVARIAGQVVKRYHDMFIVNYDLPALLHKNSVETDIAVMLFRADRGYELFFDLADTIRDALIAGGLLSKRLPISRAVHFSRSPFEQLLDARDYLLQPDGSPVEIEHTSFGRFLLQSGVPCNVIHGLVDHPICWFRDRGEQSLLDICEGYDYAQAYDVLTRMAAQARLPSAGLPDVGAAGDGDTAPDRAGP